MNNEAIVLGPKGITMLAAAEAWADYAREHNIKNPMNELLELINKYSVRQPDDTYIISDYSEEDKEIARQLRQDKYAYMRARDRFKAEWIAATEGWRLGYECAKIWNNEWNDLLWYYEEYIVPCDYGECNIFCKHFKDCIKKGFSE